MCLYMGWAYMRGKGVKANSTAYSPVFQDIPQWQKSIISRDDDFSETNCEEILQFENNKPKLPPIGSVVTSSNHSVAMETEPGRDSDFDTSTFIKESINEFVQHQLQDDTIVLNVIEEKVGKSAGGEGDDFMCPFDDDDQHTGTVTE